MEPTDLRGRLALACLQQGLPALRQTVRTGTWDEVLVALRAEPDDVAERLVRATVRDVEANGDDAAEVWLLGVRQRGPWLAHVGAVTEPERLLVLADVAEFAVLLGCETVPTELLVVTTGSPRYRSGVAIDPVWRRAMSTIDRLTTLHNPGFECAITNAVVHDAHLSNQRAVRSFFNAAAVGAHTGHDHPWAIPWRLACQGFLLEAIYADGVAQVATRVL